jgi:hypothetical protein
MKSPIYFLHLTLAISSLGYLLLIPLTALAMPATQTATSSSALPAHDRLLAQLYAADPPPRSRGGGTTYEKPPTRLGGGSRFVPTLQQGTEAPGRSRGGASRSTCPAVTTELTALIPSAEVVTQRPNGRPRKTTNVIGQTTVDHPTFWFYVPYTNQNENLTEFVLQDAKGTEIYRTRIDLSAKPGIVAVRLPKTAPKLESGERYQWFFQYYCAREKTARPIFVNGWIQRIDRSPDLQKQITAAITPRDIAQVYNQNNIWFDALTALADARRANPADETLLADWKQLLEEVNLANIETEPFAN